VSLVTERKLVRGHAAYAVRHEGRVFHLKSAESVERFRQQPDRYVPANDGACPVAEVDNGRAEPGDPRFGVLYQNHLFLCANEANRRRFVHEPDRYAIADVVEGGFCLHCIRDSGLLVRGDPREEITVDRQRYWFPDSSHREAFLASRP
jgi:YHS domain-containing protein